MTINLFVKRKIVFLNGATYKVVRKERKVKPQYYKEGGLIRVILKEKSERWQTTYRTAALLIFKSLEGKGKKDTKFSHNAFDNIDCEECFVF